METFTLSGQRFMLCRLASLLGYPFRKNTSKEIICGRQQAFINVLLHNGRPGGIERTKGNMCICITCVIENFYTQKKTKANMTKCQHKLTFHVWEYILHLFFSIFYFYIFYIFQNSKLKKLRCLDLAIYRMWIKGHKGGSGFCCLFL